MTYEENETEVNGKLVCDDGTYQGTLVLESYQGRDSKKIFKFELNENDKNDEIKHVYKISFKAIDGAICPECEMLFFDEREQHNGHLPNCKFKFKPGEINKILDDQNQKSNIWVWHDDPFYTYEAALLNLFEESYCRFTDPFKKFSNFIYQKANYLYKLVNKNNYGMIEKCN